MTEPAVIGLLHPGEMGSTVGQCLADIGHPVLWASHGRSQASTARARESGLTDVGQVTAIASQAAIIISVCPPHAAVDVAKSVHGFRGLYLDANATSPQTGREIAGIVEEGGATYVDGGIIGPPPATAGSTRLYVSGPSADTVRELFEGTALEARVVAGDPWSASAVKMAYAGWTKGSAALLLACKALADAAGVSDTLLAEWALSQPGLDARLGGAGQSAASKGWRWIAEMEEIAATMADAGQPDGFHTAAAQVYRRWSGSGGRQAGDDV
jgi:3-hydroxyisobutyrate dehydrogenase-like beta-hydroxyacid dehydrogenase